MRDQLEGLIGVLALGTAVAVGARRAGVPFNAMLVVAGLVGALLKVVPPHPLDPELVLLVFLPLLVFEAALFVDVGALRQQARPIIALAVPGVAISLLTTAGVATWALALPFGVALLLGALLAITDTVSVLLAFKSERVSHRLAAIMEGESLFNDGTALALVTVCSAAVARGGSIDGLEASRSLLVATAGGVAGGLAFGVLGAAALRATPDYLTTILTSVVVAFAAALVTEHFHGSAVVAVVVAGMIVGAVTRQRLEPARVLALRSFWETSGFAVNVFLFLMVGLQLDARDLWQQTPAIALAVLALHVGRAVAVYGCFAVLKAFSRDRVPLRYQHVMLLGNIKGALSMAAVLALPADLPYRDRLVTIVFGVTLVTLVTQAMPFRRALRALGVVLGPADRGFEQARATLIAARRGQLVLDDLLASGLLARTDHAEERAALQRQVLVAERTLRAAPASADDEHTRMALLLGQKAALTEAARRGVIDPDVAASLISDIDQHLVDHEAHHDEGGHDGGHDDGLDDDLDQVNPVAPTEGLLSLGPITFASTSRLPTAAPLGPIAEPPVATPAPAVGDPKDPTP